MVGKNILGNLNRVQDMLEFRGDIQIILAGHSLAGGLHGQSPTTICNILDIQKSRSFKLSKDWKIILGNVPVACYIPRAFGETTDVIGDFVQKALIVTFLLGVGTAFRFTINQSARHPSILNK
jgi:hypothetical protein